MKENREIPFEGRTVSGFGMLALILMIPVIVAALFILLPEEIWWIPGVLTAVGICIIGYAIHPVERYA